MLQLPLVLNKDLSNDYLIMNKIEPQSNKDRAPDFSNKILLSKTGSSMLLLSDSEANKLNIPLLKK